MINRFSFTQIALSFIQRSTLDVVKSNLRHKQKKVKHFSLQTFIFRDFYKFLISKLWKVHKGEKHICGIFAAGLKTIVIPVCA